MANPIQQYWITINGVRINLAERGTAQLYEPVNINKNEKGDDVTLPYEDTVEQQRVSNANGFPMVVPVKIGLNENDLWTLPVEPLVTVSGGNVISKRTVAKGKGRGTIKERWSQDDYEINITGILMYYNDLNAYPEADVAKLRELCEAKQVLHIDCAALLRFDITRIVIESYDFPFTKGDNVQAYSIKAYSDDVTELLVYDEL